jgi:SAM-dependent methyltransferase
MTSDAVRWYDQNISLVSPRYESVAAESVHRWLVDLLPNAPALVLDVGAGTGRDAAWLASRGLEVIAVEPSGAMRAEAQRLHPCPSIRWIADSLPSLNHVLRLGLSFDMILLSAVWMHVLPADRTRAFRKLVTLLKPGGQKRLNANAARDAEHWQKWIRVSRREGAAARDFAHS